SLQSLALLIYFFLLYLFIANVVEREWEIHLFLGAILAAAFLAAVYGILQYFGALPGTPGVPRGTGAIISSLGNKNYLGGFLVYLVLPALILPLRLRNWLLRGLSLFALATIIYTLTLIKSDGAWLALIVSGAFLTGGFLYFKLYRALKLEKGLIIGAALVMILLGLMQALPPLPQDSSAPDGSGGVSLGQESLGIPVIDELVRLWQRNAGRVRAWDWWVGWEMLKDHPLLGVGIGHYKVQFLPYKAKFLATPRGRHYNFYIQRAAQAHNEYVQTAAEMGALGILAGGFALFVIFLSGFKRLRKAEEPRDRFIILALLAGVVAVLTHALVSFPLHLPASALDFILLLGLLNSRFFQGRAPVHIPKRRAQACASVHEIKIGRRGSWTILAFVLVLGISVTTLAYRDFIADTYLDRGERDLKYGKVEQAKEELEESLRLDFQPRKVLYLLGSIYRRLGEEQNDPELLDRSLKLLEQSLNSFQVEPTYFQLALLYLDRGEYERAMDYVNRMLAISPEPSRRLNAQYLAAVIAQERGDLDEALRRLNELIAQHKDYERAYITRAKIYQAQGDEGLARLDLEEALKIVERKLARARRQLLTLKEQGRLTLDKYAELTSEIAQLEGERKALEGLLQGG
ncbi:MAG: Wzy polymerase domain-containing protein, partial [Candidatus Bipolaricaulia bacterium]